MTEDTYTHGHHSSVLKSHTWRTAENSAGYLLPHLRADMALLDVGCGPATITCDLAERVGSVVGIEPVEDILDKARETAATRSVNNVSFEVGSVYELGFDDNTFDIVHAHQVLQHLTQPIEALREMLRVAKPGGIVAVRDADYHAMTWHPEPPQLTRWMEIYQAVARDNGAEPDAGRHLVTWAGYAGVARESIELTVDTWLFETPEDRHWWGELWAKRTVHSAFGDQAREYGISRLKEQELIADSWRNWAEFDGALFTVPNFELVIRA